MESTEDAALDQSAALGLSFTALCSRQPARPGGRRRSVPSRPLVLPQLDRERTYMLKEKKIAKIYIDVLGLAPISKDAQKLEHFNDPKIVDSKSVGDFAAVLFDVVLYQSARTKSKTQHTLRDVNELLNQLVQADSNAARKKVFMKLATEYSADEQKWIIRVILKDLKIGLRHERVLKFIHPDAMEMYNHTNDLHKVCRELRNSAVRYVPQLEPFQVFTPMLAKRVNFGECISAINVDAFVMEPKLDGERITCHVQGKESGVDCILDGEMMVWDNTEYRLHEFGLLKNTANAVRKGEATNRWLCYVVWDVVYLSGGPKAEQLILNAVMGLPLHARRKLLLRILKPLDHRIIIIEQKLVNAKVDQQVSNGGEGVIMKDLNAHYMCGESSRKTKKWLKLKPDYAGMTTDLDVIIVGGFYGTGRRRSGNVSVFLLGILAHSLDEKGAAEAIKPGATCPVVYTFAKVGTGYNLEELEQMRQELEPYWQPWDDDDIPPHLNGWKPQKSDLRPDVWIDPRHSKILEVYGFELSFTTLYQTGLTIRFPRCKAIRNDKEWYQCIDLQDLNAARGSLSTKRASEVALGQKSATKRTKKRQTISARRPNGVLQDYSRADLEGIEQERNVFEAMEFCVLPGKYQMPPQDLVSSLPDGIIEKNARQLSKQTVEKLLHSFGGTIVQNPIAGTTHYVVAAGDSGFKVVNLKKQGTSRLVSLKAGDFVFATDSQRELLAKEYDRHGDHFTEHIAPDELQRILGKLPTATKDKSTSLPWQFQMKELEMEEAEAMDSAFTFLSHCVVYFQYCSSSSEDEDIDDLSMGQIKLIEQQLRLYGGVVAREIDSSVTHVVVDPAQVEQLAPAIRNLRHQGLPEPRVVTKEWVQKCVEQRTQVPDNDFVVHV
ncbi:DNA ligase 4 [Phytophthora cactorum]|nr:DNA ligase 4 [Phytophthora cactorum]